MNMKGDYKNNLGNKAAQGKMPRIKKYGGGGGMKRKQYNKGGKEGTQPSYSSGEMPKCMPK